MSDPQARAADLAERLRAWDRAYYLEDAPVVDDATYDATLRELRALEAAHPEAARPDSPTQRVAGGVSARFTETPHLLPMLSLANARDDDELVAWDARVRKPSSRRASTRRRPTWSSPRSTG